VAFAPLGATRHKSIISLRCFLLFLSICAHNRRLFRRETEAIYPNKNVGGQHIVSLIGLFYFFHIVGYMLKSLKIYCTSVIIYSASVEHCPRPFTGALLLGLAVGLPFPDTLLYNVAPYSQEVNAYDVDPS